jgi:hypothetical protein
MLWPEDVNHATPYFTQAYPYPEGGCLNAVVNACPAAGSYNTLKVECLAWSSAYNAPALYDAAATFATAQGWAAANVRYLVPLFNAACTWQTEYAAAYAAGLPWVGFWALDQVCLLSWDLSGLAAPVVTVADPTSDPVGMQVSKDGGFTWGAIQYAIPQKLGNYLWRLTWRRLGRARDACFRVIVPHACEVVLIDAYLDVQPGKAGQ